MPQVTPLLSSYNSLPGIHWAAYTTWKHYGGSDGGVLTHFASYPNGCSLVKYWLSVVTFRLYWPFVRGIHWSVIVSRQHIHSISEIRGFPALIALCVNNVLNNQSSCRKKETPQCLCDATLMYFLGRCRLSPKSLFHNRFVIVLSQPFQRKAWTYAALVVI